MERITYIIEETMMDKITREEKDDYQEKISACWMDAIQGISRKKKLALVETYGHAKDVILLKEMELQQYLNLDELYRWQQFEKEKSPYQVWEELHKKEISFVSNKEKNFPEKLRNIPDAPFAIYYKGKLPQNDKPSIAMVGARKCSDYGKCMAEYFADRLAKNGVDIISGMAYGIDSYSQRAAIKAGGQSYAVFGCGVDVVYPPVNRDLYTQLLTKGGVISEYGPGTQPLPQLFPPRNRIISALSDVVLVVEAKEKSGTLITVDMALEQGREVYVIPGRCTDSLSRGCNKLLRQGAFAALEPDDIMHDMKWQMENEYSRSLANSGYNFNNLSEIGKDIVSVLDVLPCTQDEVLNQLFKKQKQYTVSKVCQGLIELELLGIVQRTYGQYKLSVKK